MKAVPSELIVRAPRPSESPALRMLLPEACDNAPGRDFRLGFYREGTKIQAALSFYDDGKALTSVRVQVVPSRRRMGIGSLMLESVAEEARRLGRARIIADVNTFAEPDSEPFLLANGFTRTSRLTSVAATPQEVAAEALTLRDRTPPLAELSPEARIVGIEEAPADQLMQMYSEYIADMPVMGNERTWQLERFKESVILMIGDRVIGAMLCEVRDRVLRIPAWMVVPEFRGKAVGLQLRLAMLNRSEGRWGEADLIQFDFLDKAQATAKIADRAGYKVVAVRCRFEKLAADGRR